MFVLSNYPLCVCVNPWRSTMCMYNIFGTRTRVFACGVSFRDFETKSHGLLLLPLQDIHLSLPLWPAGLQWYIFKRFALCVCVCMLLVRGLMLVIPMYWDAVFFRIHGHMLSRVCKCVPERCSAAAACPCAGLMKKIIRVILMQMNEASLYLSPLPLSPEYPVLAEEGGQAWLNCFLPWHRLLLGKTEYHYSWAPGEPGAKKVSLTLLVLYQTIT